MSNNKIVFGSVEYCEIHRLLQGKKFLNTDETAIYLGITKNYLYKLNQRNIIKRYSPNNKMNYYLREDLDRYITSRGISGTGEISKEVSNYFLTSKF